MWLAPASGTSTTYCRPVTRPNLCFSTDSTGQEYGYYGVLFKVGDFRKISGTSGHRVVPSLGTPAVASSAANWLKTRADLLRLASEKPGALAAQFVLAIRAAMNCDQAASSTDFHGVDLMRWGGEGSGLKEVRDLRGVQALMMVLHGLSADEVVDATDVIAQRVKSILAAKTTNKGSWERSQGRALGRGRVDRAAGRDLGAS